ncbi:ribosome silencing factor [Guptibacillus algicola]|uniref:ribosome silencing factor n=1 Tax=Guptibacillus algicola TaxID=225844 RepID=UPI001CD3EF26|nr:ribosome silencing factor [Alkalihalobacillus algicola]MCA0986116.1 ribosome silencing factor [Alkalihalobacillus algicola]
MEETNMITLAAKAADDKRAEDIIALNMNGVSLIADYFLICHGNSEKQVQAIATEVKNQALEQGMDVKRLEGYDQARWVLVDLGSVIVHIFHKDERNYYNLEKLWGDAPHLPLNEILA